MKRTLIILTIFITASCVSAVSFAGERGKNKKQSKQQLLERIDFGNSYIMGQSIKSGAVYLLQRKKSEIKSMLRQRKDYRPEILEDFEVQSLNITESGKPKVK